MSTKVVVTLIITLSILAASARGESRDEFEVRGWSGWASYSESGQINRCTLAATFEGDETLAFALANDGVLTVAVSNPSWVLEDGAIYPVIVAVDQLVFGEADATASDNAIVIVVGNNPEFFERIQRGRTLHIEAATATMSFDLAGTFVALERLQLCVRNATAVARNPFVGTPAPRGPTKNPFIPSARTETVDDNEARSLDELGRFVNWSQRFQAVYKDLVGALDTLAQMDEITGALLEGEVTFQFAQQQIKQLTVSVAATLSSHESKIASIRNEPPFQTSQFRQHVDGNLQYLDTLNAQLTNSLEESMRLFVAVSEGDDEAVVQLGLKMFDSQIGLLEAENVSLRLSNQALDSDHPQRFLQLAMAAGNSALIAMLEAQRQFLMNPLVSSPDAGRDQIVAAFGWIEAGRTAADEFLVEYSQLPPFKAVIDQMIDSYHTALDLEIRILTIFAEIDVNDENDMGFLLIPTLVDRRLDLAADRTTIAEKLAAMIEGG